MDGWMDGLSDGWMDEWMDMKGGHINRQVFESRDGGRRCGHGLGSVSARRRSSAAAATSTSRWWRKNVFPV